MLLFRLLIGCLFLSTCPLPVLCFVSSHAKEATRSATCTGSRRSTELAVANNLGVTSGFIATLAETALKLRLKGQTYVKFDVTAKSEELLQGRVGPVSVKGRAWQSPRGLTCRAIEATVGECELDMSKIVAQQKLLLITPALGESFIAMNADDFGNFLVHPLIRPPHVEVDDEPASSPSIVQFQKDGVSIDPQKKCVIFYGDLLSHKYQFNLRRYHGGNAVVTAQRCDDDDHHDDDTDDSIPDNYSEALAEALSKFFNHLEVELDGTFLRYKDMSISGKGASPSVMLKLGITVRKFPSPGVPF